MGVYKLSQCWGTLVVPTKLCIGTSLFTQFFRIADFYELQLFATDVITVVY